MNTPQLLNVARQFVKPAPLRMPIKKDWTVDLPPIRWMVWTYACQGTDQPALFGQMIAHQAKQAARFGAVHHVEFGEDVNMYERCEAMVQFVLSPRFRAPTVFMDNDAFPNRDLLPVFDQIQHIGLTTQEGPDLMPINEGVIFAKPTDETRAFFRSYLGTYEAIRPPLTSEADWKWMGGQLALNVIDHRDAVLLPGDPYNFSPRERMTTEELDRIVVLHLKGKKKRFFESLVEYQSR